MRLNPCARVETTRGPAGEIDGLRIVAPVKGRGLQRTWISRADHPDRFDRSRRAVLTALFDVQAGCDPWPGASSDERTLFETSGLFVSDAEMPREVVPDLPPLDLSSAFPGDADLVREGFAVVPGFARGPLLDALRRYYAALVEEGFAKSGGEHGEPFRWVLHNDPAARTIHPPLTPLVSRLAGEPLKPSFTYLIKYLEGAALDAHRDREQCAVTAVLQVDFDPEPVGVTPWPLIFSVPDGPRHVLLACGDLLVFRGTAIEHYREPLACGCSSTNLAFCFVPESFAGSLD
jgi:hypothetical protein